MGIKLGPWSTILLLGSIHGVVVAMLLARARRQQPGNRLLAALLLVVVLRITPYTIGYAGFYDAYPWLSFAPFDLSLAVGPLIYLYVRVRSTPTSPRRWGWHLAPVALQATYYLVAFVQPLAWKDAWDDRVHVPWIVPIETWATYASMAWYWTRALSVHRQRQRWLEHHSAAREEHRDGWLGGCLIAFAAMTALQVGFDLVELTGRHLDYFDRFPLYVALTALVYYLGIEGWRHADRTLPMPDDAVAVEPMPPVEATPASAVIEPAPIAAPPSPAARPTPERDWAAIGRGWAERVAAAGWWREPELGLAELARRLGTNTRYLSRALNDGLGMSFSEFINRQRVDEARRRLAGDGEILAIALDVGFASKASFNRAFKAYAGCTPSEFRTQLTAAPAAPDVAMS